MLPVHWALCQALRMRLGTGRSTALWAAPEAAPRGHFTPVNTKRPRLEELCVGDKGRHFSFLTWIFFHFLHWAVNGHWHLHSILRGSFSLVSRSSPLQEVYGVCSQMRILFSPRELEGHTQGSPAIKWWQWNLNLKPMLPLILGDRE